MKVDLNADLAEGCGNDQALLQRVTSANMACGVHAGDAVEMLRALQWAKANGVRVGAHPSFPDREHFGRSQMDLSDEQLRAHLLYQLGALQALCDAVGVQLAYVKPHGALYNQASKDERLATIIVQTVRDFDARLKIMALSGSLLLQTAQRQQMGVISEVFADRRYLPDGSLVARSHPEALVASDEQAIVQVLQMVQTQTVQAIDGSNVAVQADSICLHGDGEHALAFADAIRQALRERGIEIQSA